MRSLPYAVALLAAACAPRPDDFRSILPDERLLIDESAFTDALSRGIGEPSEYYELTRGSVEENNAMIGDVLGLVDAITAYDPTWSDDDATMLWGPWLDDGIYGQLWVRQEGDGSWSWAIEIRPESSAEDAWQGVLAGHVEPGATEERSAGWWQMDLTAIEGAGAGDGTTGQVACAYDIAPDLVTAELGFGSISEDGSMPADGLYHYEQTPSVGGLLDLAIDGDISDPPNGTAEVLVIRSRWLADGQGRADAYVTGGDAGPLTYTETDCWDRGHRSVFLENNFELYSEGDEARCAFDEPSFNEG